MIFKNKPATAIHRWFFILSFTLTLAMGWNKGWADEPLSLNQMSLLDDEQTLDVGDRLSYRMWVTG